jgi:hypothetical protein
MNLIQFKDSKIVNLDNTSSIHLDTQGNKVIFNMGCSVRIFGKTTPDYVYWHFRTEEELQKIEELITNKIEHWILPVEEGQRYLNPKYISNITVDENPGSNRIIFNLTYNVTHPKDENKLTSHFLFYDFMDDNKYKTFKNEILNLTTRIGD